ncbi:hypothetical protein [Gordonia bronchialis]|uniref:hypothetical protein n=1 Tax=Gordonia bronchialis TaxID=2054 RepID=UPI00226D7F65|nr:hypothetical protein [Gordonia bronchialis]
MTLHVVIDGGATPWWQNWLPVLGSCVVAGATLIGVLISAGRTREGRGTPRQATDDHR